MNELRDVFADEADEVDDAERREDEPEEDVDEQVPERALVDLLLPLALW